MKRFKKTDDWFLDLAAGATQQTRPRNTGPERSRERNNRVFRGKKQCMTAQASGALNTRRRLWSYRGNKGLGLLLSTL